MYYYFIIGLQGLCIYHAIRTKKQQQWYYIIFFIPVIGALIYLFTQVFNRHDARIIQNELSTILVPTKKVKDLEKQVSFANTYQNRVNLAEAYFEMDAYNEAIEHYALALEGHHSNDFSIRAQLVASHYYIGDYQEAIAHAKHIEKEAKFNKSRAQFLYGLALEKQGYLEEAESQMRHIDQRYSNYEERLKLAKFLIDREKKDDAKELLQELYTESEHMTRENKKRFKRTMSEVADLLSKI